MSAAADANTPESDSVRGAPDTSGTHLQMNPAQKDAVSAQKAAISFLPATPSSVQDRASTEMSQEIDREKGQRIIDDFARYGNETPYWSGRGCFFTPCLHGRGPTLAEQAEAFYRAAKRKTLYERLYARPSRTLLASWKSLKRENRAKPAEPRPPVLPLHGGLIDVGPLLQGTAKSAQSQSPLLTLLPLEIRNHIYSFVLPPQSRVWVRYRPLERTKGRLRSNNSGGRLPLEHFPCREVPSDMRYTERYEHCGCNETYIGFFGRVDTLGLQPHQDTLSLIKTCQRM